MAVATAFGHERKARRLVELFHGRFSVAEARVLIESHNDMNEAIDFVLTGEPDTVREFIHVRLPASLESLRSNANQVWQELADGIPVTYRQFGCEPCDLMWWYRVPVRKQVSKCRRCRIKYDPIPRDQEWGLAEFECQQCGNTFRAISWMAGEALSPCFRCLNLTPPVRIIYPPPTPITRTGGSAHTHIRRRRGIHCTGENCFARCNIVEGFCVHPLSRPGRNVHYPSNPHNSTGSTVETFLTQIDIDQQNVDFDILPSVAEEDSDS